MMGPLDLGFKVEDSLLLVLDERGQLAVMAGQASFFDSKLVAGLSEVEHQAIALGLQLLLVGLRLISLDR